TYPGGEPIILDTACFSIYSLISNLTSESLVPNNSSARTLDNSVLPTPVGPTNKNEPIGRVFDFNPARLLRTALATRSEERRVGKECRTRRATTPDNEKNEE